MREWIRARPDQAATAFFTEADLHEAYARGRRDERARRRRAPAASLTLSLAALAGAGMLAFSAWQGAFSGNGVIDDQIADAVISAEPHVRAAAAETRGALMHAGDEARARASSLIGG